MVKRILFVAFCMSLFLTIMYPSISNAIPFPGLTGVDYTFTANLGDAHLAINAGQIMKDESSSLTLSGLWELKFNITLDADIDDEIYINGTLQHTSEPHPPEGNGTTYPFNFTGLAENGPNNAVYKLTNEPVNLSHADHYDYFYNNKLAMNISTTFPDIDNIVGWNFTLDAVHATYSIPEPSALLLLGTGLVGIFVFGRKRLFKKA